MKIYKFCFNWNIQSKVLYATVNQQVPLEKIDFGLAVQAVLLGESPHNPTLAVQNLH